MTSNLPTQQLLVRSSEGFITERTSTAQFRTGPLANEALTAAEKNEQIGCADEAFARYSKDGKRVSVITPDAINIYDADEEKVELTIEGNFHEAYFSPRGNFLVTFTRKSPKNDGENLLIWSMKDGKQVKALHLKEKNPETWPILRWSDDEQVLAHLVTNQINFYDGTNPGAGQVGKLHIKYLFTFDIAANGEGVVVFVPDKKGQPANACIYSIAKTADSFTVSPTPTAAKSFFRATAAKFTWSPLGNAVLVTATTDIDKTGESYYGESQLHLLYTNGECQTVPFGTNKGPIHDAQWSPQGTDFVTIQGFQPAKITLFNAANCTPVREFGTLSRNTILFSPHGRFLCIGGFGNLAGEMDFWEKNKFKQLGTCQDMAGATTFEWTPDSRNFITAALFPRRRVDEGIKVWTYYGEKVYEQKIPKLTQVAIRPAMPEVFPNRPMSPRLSDRRIQKEIAQKMEASKPKAYVPPHLRGKGGGSTSNIVKVSKENTGPRKLKGLVADLDPETKAANAAAQAEKNAEKNKKRRERRKQQAVVQKSDEELAKEKAAEDRAAKQAEVDARNANLGEGELMQKKLKKLQKQERQVQKLLQQKKDGKQLDASQKSKLDGHAAMQKQIADLEESIKNL